VIRNSKLLPCAAFLQRFVCESCATRDTFIVSNDVVEELEAINRMPVSEFAERQTPSEVLFEVRALAGTIRRHFLGQELKSFEVLSAVVAQ
jgi:hypothetical protein